MDLKDLKGKKITVMGLGLLSGGVGTVKFLVNNGTKVLVTDKKSRKELKQSIRKLKSLPVRYVLGKHRFQDFINTDLVIRNPAVKKDSPYLKIAKEHGIPIETDASLFFQFCPVPIIGVTGTKGKSTTVALLEKMLRKNGIPVVLVGHNKISVLDRLSLVRKKSLVLFELSSWRLESLKEIKSSPWFSIVTNIIPDHLNTYRGMKEYQEAKKNIFQFQSSKDFVVLNKDNPFTKNFGKEVKSRCFWFSTKFFPRQNGGFIKEGKIYFREKGKTNFVADITNLKLLGNHNKENVLAAVATAKILKVSNHSIIWVLSHFPGLPDRLEHIRTWRGIKFYNDTAATIPDATIAALNSFSRKIILIAGGQDKKLNYSELARVIKKKVRYLALLPGTATKKLVRYLKYHSISFSQHRSLSSAFKTALQKARSDDIVLFSPGAASFNLFQNEFDRGKQFSKLVQSIP